MDLFIAWDGDHIGRKVGLLALADDVEGLRRVSQAIDNGNKIWASWVNAVLGEMVSYGGDEGRARVPADSLEELDRMRKQYATAVGSSVSVGVGVKLSEADRALLAAKLRGGDQIILYTPEVDEILAQTQEKTEAQKIQEEYLGKADAPEPPSPETTAKENKGNAGGGFTGFHEPGTGGEPVGPMAEASEHSQGESMRAMADSTGSPETTHGADEFEQALHDGAQQQDDEDEAKKQAGDEKGQARQQIVEILSAVRQYAPQFEQLRAAAPDMYQALMGMVQALMIAGHSLVETDPESGQGQEQAPPGGDESSSTPSEVSKSECSHFYGKGDRCLRCKTEKGLEKAGELPLTAPPVGVRAGPALHTTVEGFMGGLKQLPKGSPERGKFITSHMNHAPFLTALQAHPQGKQVHAMLTQHLNSPQNAGFLAGQAKAVVKEELDSESVQKGLPLPENQPGKHQVNLPVGATKDGKVKVRHGDGKAGWVSVRAGQVLSNDGHPVSSRNPSGG